MSQRGHDWSLARNHSDRDAQRDGFADEREHTVRQHPHACRGSLASTFEVANVVPNVKAK